MRSDSPPPSWYEPVDVVDDEQDLAEPEPEWLIAAGGIVRWHAGVSDADD